MKGWLFGKRLAREEGGQSIVIMAIAFIALILVVGLALDLGMMYVERIRLGRACDAAALAAAQELPFERQAWARALEYLRLNGYDTSNVEIEIYGYPDESPAAPPDPKGRIVIDTFSYQDDQMGTLPPGHPDRENTADKIRVYGQVMVPLNLMRLIGFSEVPVEAEAVAENVSSIDVAIVFDKSGSMAEDTRCWGCYQEGSSVYPAGTRYYLPFNETVCDTVYDPYYYYSGSRPRKLPWDNRVNYPSTLRRDKYYYVIEAEHYDYTTHDYHREYYERPMLYWAMQRTAGACASGNDDRGAFMMLGPHTDIPEHTTVTADTPRLDYTVHIVRPGTYYLWIRAQGGYGGWSVSSGRLVHWGVDGVYQGSSTDFPTGGYNAGVISSGSWVWKRMGGVYLSAGDHTINIWGGSPGFRIDRLVLTDDGEWSSSNGSGDRTPSFLQTNSCSGTYIGPPESPGRTGWACDQCNPIYGLRVGGQCDNTFDDLFDDAQPIRAAKEAAKSFIERLNPRFDQVGFVYYSTSASIGSELRCVRRYGAPSDSMSDQEAWEWCYGAVISSIENLEAGGGTNIAYGLLQGLNVLSTEGGHYGRPTAAHVIILMTDGQANQIQGLSSTCYSDGSIYPPQPGESSNQRRARLCTVYYALQARDRSVIVYTIGLGAQADHALLQYVADLTGGVYYLAPRAEDLEAIFQQIADNIFLRLVR